MSFHDTVGKIEQGMEKYDEIELSTLEISRKVLAMLTGLPTYFDKRPQPSGNLFNLVDTVLKVGIEKAKKDVEEEGVEIIEKFLVEKESVILRLSDFAEQVFNQIHPNQSHPCRFKPENTKFTMNFTSVFGT